MTARPVASSVLGLWTQMTMVLAASLLLVASGKITIPFYPVPMTLQSGAVVLIGLTLGLRLGCAAVGLYLVQGALGLPVFAGSPAGSVGLAYMVGPTGGYLAGFLAAAAVAGWLAERGWTATPVRATVAALVASVIVYVPGLIWLGMYTGYGDRLLALGLYPFLAGDLLKAAAAAMIVTAMAAGLGLRRQR